MTSIIEGIPLYISDPKEPRAFLTFSTTINGKWVAGYSNTEGGWLSEPLVKGAETLEDAVKQLSELHKEG